MILRLTEHEFLATPELWSSAGLDAWLTERGLDTRRSYTRSEQEHEFWFTQDEPETLGVYHGECPVSASPIGDA